MGFILFGFFPPPRNTLSGNGLFCAGFNDKHVVFVSPGCNKHVVNDGFMVHLVPRFLWWCL